MQLLLLFFWMGGGGGCVLMFLCITDERWKDSGAFKHFFYLVYCYYTRYISTRAIIVAIVDCASMYGQLQPPLRIW